MKTTLTVSGLDSDEKVKEVKDTITASESDAKVTVDKESGKVTVESEASEETFKELISALGYEVQ